MGRGPEGARQTLGAVEGRWCLSLLIRASLLTVGLYLEACYTFLRRASLSEPLLEEADAQLCGPRGHLQSSLRPGDPTAPGGSRQRVGEGRWRPPSLGKHSI